MPHNVELKARIRSIAEARRIALSLGAEDVGILRQRDTFLMQGARRIKLREEAGKCPEVIYYSRPNAGTRSGRWSAYMRLPVSSARAILDGPQWKRRDRIVVTKVRSLYIFRNSRIHLDRVKGLGTFLEFEVLLRRGERQAQQLLRKLAESFEIREQDIVPGAYADLLMKRLQP